MWLGNCHKNLSALAQVETEDHGSTQPGTLRRLIDNVQFSDLRLSFKVIGVYLDRCYGDVHFRVLWDLGSNENVCCVVELVYPKWARGVRCGIPWGVVRLEKPSGFSPPLKGVG